MSDSKPWWTSRTVWAGAVALAAGIFGASDADTEQLQQLVLGIVTAATSAGAIIYRIVAKSRLRA